MKWYKNPKMYWFVFWGFFGGLVFWVAGIWLEFNRENLPLTLWPFLYLHRIEPMVFMLDFAPALFALLAGLFGYQRSLSVVISRGKKEWELIFDSFSDLIFITDANTVIVRCNHAVVDRLNTQFAKVIGKPLASVLGDAFIEKQKKGEAEFLWLNRLYEVSYHLDEVSGTDPKKLIVLHDITERKQIEDKLFLEHSLLRTLIDNLPDRIYVKDTQGRKTISNQADMLASGAKSMQSIIGKSDFDLYPVELAQKFWNDDKIVLDTQLPVLNHEEPGLDDLGRPVWVMTSKIPVKDS